MSIHLFVILDGIMAQPSRKEREFVRHRKEILEAALELFAKQGFHGTSMQQIAEAAEFSVGTLYKFFPHKEEIYQTLIEETADRFHAGLIAALETPGDEIDKLRAAVEVKIRIFLDNLDRVRIYFAETQGASFNVKTGLDDKIKSRYDDYLERLCAIFASGIQKKTFRKEDPYLLALAFDSLSMAFLVEQMEHPGRHPFDTETVLAVFLQGASFNQ